VSLPSEVAVHRYLLWERRVPVVRGSPIVVRNDVWVRVGLLGEKLLPGLHKSRGLSKSWLKLQVVMFFHRRRVPQAAASRAREGEATPHTSLGEKREGWNQKKEREVREGHTKKMVHEKEAKRKVSSLAALAHSPSVVLAGAHGRAAEPSNRSLASSGAKHLPRSHWPQTGS